MRLEEGETRIDLTAWMNARYNSLATNRELLEALTECDSDNYYHCVECIRDGNDPYILSILWKSARPHRDTTSQQAIAYPDQEGAFKAMDEWLRDCINDAMDVKCDTEALTALLVEDSE